jgi:glycosyltransferase involved in cell wall biosynthesis
VFYSYSNKHKDKRGEDLVSMVGALPPLKGNAYYCMGLAREMSRRISVDFIAFKKLYPDFLYPGGVNEEDPKFKIRESPTLSIRRIIAYYNPISWIRAGLLVRGDIVHLQWWSIPVAPIYLVLLFVLKLRKKKIIFTIHNNVPHESSPVDKILTKAVLRFGDKYIIHSKANIEGLLRRFGVPEASVHEVHMPVHEMYGGGDGDRNLARTEIGIPLEAKVVLSFGNLREYKGIDVLISAFSFLVKELPAAHLLIVGQAWGDWDRYGDTVLDLNLRDNVTTVLEYVPMSEVEKYFSASDLVALPYKEFDAQSGVGNIALSFGLPLVVTRVGGLPDLVNDERAIVEPNDVKSLATAIKEILRNQRLYTKLCEDSETLRKKYSWSAAIESTLSIYRNM